MRRRSYGSTNRARIVDLLTEWHPQHLTYQELALLLGGDVTTATARNIAHQLEAEGRARIERRAHYRANGKGPGADAVYHQP